MTLQNSYSVRQSLAGPGTGDRRGPPLAANRSPPRPSGDGAELGVDQTVRLNVNPSARRSRPAPAHRPWTASGTTSSAWSRRWFGPLKLTTLDRGRRHRRGQHEKHYRRIQANLVTGRQGRGELSAAAGKSAGHPLGNVPGICPTIVTSAAALPCRNRCADGLVECVLGNVIAISGKGAQHDSHQG